MKSNQKSIKIRFFNYEIEIKVMGTPKLKNFLLWGLIIGLGVYFIAVDIGIFYQQHSPLYSPIIWFYLPLLNLWLMNPLALAVFIASIVIGIGWGVIWFVIKRLKK